MSGLDTSWRVMADVLDVGAEAGTALATLTATAIAALLAPPNHTTLKGVPDLAGGLDRHRSRPAGDIFAMPSGVPTRPPHPPRPPRPSGPVHERGAETVAAVVLHAAALAVGAAAALASTVQTTARVATWPLRASAATADPVPDAVRAAAHVTDLAAARIEGWAHPCPTPAATSTPGSPPAAPRAGNQTPPASRTGDLGPVTTSRRAAEATAVVAAVDPQADEPLDGRGRWPDR